MFSLPGLCAARPAAGHFISHCCVYLSLCACLFFSSPPPAALSFHRASEQKRINATAARLNSSGPRQPDLDLYLGVYAGDARRAHTAFFLLCMVFVAENAAAIQ